MEIPIPRMEIKKYGLISSAGVSALTKFSIKGYADVAKKLFRAWADIVYTIFPAKQYITV